MIEKDKQRHGECFCGSVTVSAELPRERTARAAAKLNSGGSALAPLPNLQLTDRAGRPEPRRGEKKGNKTKTIASKAVRLSSVHQLDRCSAHFYTCCATLRGNVRVVLRLRDIQTFLSGKHAAAQRFLCNHTSRYSLKGNTHRRRTAEPSTWRVRYVR